MATYVTSYYTVGTYNPSTNTFTATSASVSSVNSGFDNEPVGGGQKGDTTFERNDNMVISGADAHAGNYAGHTSDGYIVHQGNNYYYYSNSPISQNQTISFSMEDFPVCFLTGTRIATPQGDVAVEDLRIGDRVLTADGRAETIRFIGRQTFSTLFADRESTYPVRIRAGALAEGVPAADLWVSPGHALHIDGVLVAAAALVNGDTIAQLPPPAEVFTYYNLELDEHEVLLAEGTEVESFADNVPRTRFHNHAEFVALYPEGRDVGEMDQPRAASARQVPSAIRRQIASRSALLAHPRQQAA